MIGFPPESGFNICNVKVTSSRAGTLESQVTGSAYNTCHTLGSSQGANLFSPDIVLNRTKKHKQKDAPFSRAHFEMLTNIQITLSKMDIFGTDSPGGEGGGTLGISGWGCAAGSLEPLTFTRASSVEFCYPILE